MLIENGRWVSSNPAREEKSGNVERQQAQNAEIRLEGLMKGGKGMGGGQMGVSFRHGR